MAEAAIRHAERAAVDGRSPAEAFGPGGFRVGRSALGSNPMQTPAIGLSPMAVGAPGEHLPGPDGVIQQATVESMDPVGSVNLRGCRSLTAQCRYRCRWAQVVWS